MQKRVSLGKFFVGKRGFIVGKLGTESCKNKLPIGINFYCSAVHIQVLS